jgi:hypothetical protein
MRHLKEMQNQSHFSFRRNAPSIIHKTTRNAGSSTHRKKPYSEMLHPGSSSNHITLMDVRRATMQQQLQPVSLKTCSAIALNAFSSSESLNREAKTDRFLPSGDRIKFS